MESKSACTWPPCQSQATHPYHDAHGRIWANLCPIHSLTLDTALAGDDKRVLLTAWVKASGGAEKLASSFGSSTKEPTGEGL